MFPSLLLVPNLFRALQGEAPSATPETTGTPPAAGETDDASGGGPDFFLLLIALVAVFYFVMILPEKKNRKKRELMLGALKKGDQVMTTSGIYGSVVMTADDVVTVQVAEGVRMRFSRAAIQNVLAEEKAAEASKA
jgi:preprotein translocase subunit YajC